MGTDVPPPAPSHRRRHHRPDLHHGPSHHLIAGASFRAELWEESLRKATELAQAVANALFLLPVTEGCDGPVVRLPPPTNRLPHEKHKIYQGEDVVATLSEGARHCAIDRKRPGGARRCHRLCPGRSADLNLL
ncbi:hypothetical protein ACQJBY_066473 [Aegilops geniculata]